VTVTREQADSLTRGAFTPKSPVQVHWFMGRQTPSDFIWTTMVSPLIVSARVISLLQENRVTGWSSYPIEVMNRDGEVLDGYQGLSTTGRCGPLEFERSAEVPKNYPAGVFPVYQGLFFSPESWDGADLFMPSDDTLFVFAVDRVQKLFHKAKITNVAFERADLIERATRD
jgi:hypothetical protein